MAQIYFKIMKVSDYDDKSRELRRKIICNIIFNILENCEVQHFYYPLKALAEMFSES